MSSRFKGSPQRITFNCPKELKVLLTKLSEKEGISRNQKIIELIEIGLKNQEGFTSIQPAFNTIDNLTKRVDKIEALIQANEDWKQDFQENVDNLEKTIANILNQDITEFKSAISSSKSIPKPK
jgi:predicted DNA-binding protein